MKLDHRYWIWPVICIVPVLVMGWPLIRGFACYSPQEGDLVFQALPRNQLVDAIEGISRAPYSHCGMVTKKDGSWYVIEALGVVKETRLSSWILQGRNAEFDAFRLRSIGEDRLARAVAQARTLLGRHYDIHYRFDNDDIYCSELIYRAFKDGAGIVVGKIDRIGDLAWKPFEGTIQAIEKGPVPLDREMITPVAIAEDPGLVKCFGDLRRK